MTPQTRDVLWLLNLSASIFGLLIWMTWVRFHWRQRRYAWAPLSFMLHSIIYFTVRLLASHDPDPFFQVWCSILIGHALGIGIGIGLVWVDVVHYGN